MKRAICLMCEYKTDQYNTFAKVSNHVWEDGGFLRKDGSCKCPGCGEYDYLECPGCGEYDYLEVVEEELEE